MSGSASSRVYVARADGRIEEVFNGRDLVTGVASTRAGPLIHVAFDSELVAYGRSKDSWEPAMRRKGRITHLAALGADHLAVVPAGRKWLEIWVIGDSLKTVALCYMPISVNCISARDHCIVLGTQDGRHALLTVHHSRRLDT